MSTSQAALQATQAAEQAMLTRATAAEDRLRQLDVQCSDVQQEAAHTKYVALRGVDRIEGALWKHNINNTARMDENCMVMTMAMINTVFQG